jgi:hypothetical protein
VITVGDEFAYWTVIRHEGGARYHCQCKCGTERTLYASGLIHNKNPSCGCIRRNRVPKVGDTVGEWTVLSWDGPPSRKALCQCSCGTIKDVEIYTLGKDSLSCGHARVPTAVIPRAPGTRRADNANEKRCAACQQVKTLDSFHRDAKSADGRRPRCKSCVKAYDDSLQDERNRRARETYGADPASKIQKTTIYRRENPGFGDLETRIARGGGLIAGDVTAETLRLLKTDYNDACYICEISFGEAAVHWDHFRPIAKGGDHSLANLRPACESCNKRKQARWPFTPEMQAEIRSAVQAERHAGLELASLVRAARRNDLPDNQPEWHHHRPRSRPPDDALIGSHRAPPSTSKNSTASRHGFVGAVPHDCKTPRRA